MQWRISRCSSHKVNDVRWLKSFASERATPGHTDELIQVRGLLPALLHIGVLRIGMELAAPVSSRHDFYPKQQFEEEGGGGSTIFVAPQGAGSRSAGRGAANSTPRAMKDEALGTAPAAAAAAGSSAVGAWQEPQPQTGRVAMKEEVMAPGRGHTASTPLETSQLDPRAPVRKGKWTPEEEMYTTRIISDFNKGLLPLAPGTTLRSYLSEKLNW